MDGTKVNLQTATTIQHAGKSQVSSKKSQSAPISFTLLQPVFHVSRAALKETLHVNRNLKDCVNSLSVIHKNTDFLFAARRNQLVSGTE